MIRDEQELTEATEEKLKAYLDKFTNGYIKASGKGAAAPAEQGQGG